MIWLGILLLLASSHYSNGAKILGVFTAPAISHYRLGSALMRALAEKGHDVTVISCFGEKIPPKNGTYRDILVSEIRDEMLEKQKSGEMNMFDREGTNPALTILFLGAMISTFMNKALENENVQQLIKSDEKFDVVIIESFMNDAQYALANHFGAPLILLSTVGPTILINPTVGNPSPLSYVPDVFLGYSVPMSFCERVVNTVMYLFYELYQHLYLQPQHDDAVKKTIPGPVDDYHNVSLVLLNSHPSLSQPVPTVPNMIEIGGFHVNPPKKLPQDLQKYLDDSKDGVIYFSMGSNLKSAQFPPEKRDYFLKTFSKLKQNILWKWEDDVLPGQPKNVKLSKWLPQQDILAHRNVKLFITHGGLLSTTETVYHGVPVLAIPVFGDQKLNAKTAVNNGFGLMLPYSEISEETLTASINELLTNKKYTENAKKYSTVFHDRQVPPLDTAIYWVEYVARHQGAPHLRVAALDLPWYKYLLLDVVAFLAAVIMVSLFITCSVGKIVCRKISSRRKSKKVKTK